MWVAVSKNNSDSSVKTEQLIGVLLEMRIFDSHFTHLVGFQWEYCQGKEWFVIRSSLKS